MGAIAQVLLSYGATAAVDADATTYINALTTAGVTPTSNQQTYINTFITNAKANGWWTLKNCIYLFVWNSAGADAINVKNPGTHNMTWTGGITRSTTGITFNGSTGYGDTGIPTNTFGTDNISISAGITGNPAANKYAYGTTDGTNPSYYLRSGSRGSEEGLQFNGASATFAAATKTLLELSTVAHGTVYRTLNGTATTLSINTTNVCANNMYVGCLNNSGTAATFGGATMTYFDMGSGLTSAQTTSHWNDFSTFKTSMGF